METLTLSAPDGATLAARVFGAEGGVRGSVVIGAAMGVRQAYYAPFAQWLAGQGWRVTTFDYRGMGDSLPAGASRGLRGVRATLNDWVVDYETVVAHARAAQADGPLYLIGHSLGGQLPGLFAQPERVDGLLGVASGSGYWRDTAPALRRSAPFFWHVLVPVSTGVFGYFPGNRLGMVGDLPAGVIRQWRRWCLNPRYSAGAEDATTRYARARFPVLALSIADDEMMTQRGIENLVALYQNAPRRVQTVAPADMAVRRIGHLGAFRSEHAPVLWPQLQQWMLGLASKEST